MEFLTKHWKKILIGLVVLFIIWYFLLRKKAGKYDTATITPQINIIQVDYDNKTVDYTVAYCNNGPNKRTAKWASGSPGTIGECIGSFCNLKDCWTVVGNTIELTIKEIDSPGGEEFGNVILKKVVDLSQKPA